MDRRKTSELRIYTHEALMHDFNELQIRIKTHLFNIGDEDFKRRHPKPSVEDLDRMMSRIMAALREDSRPMRHY